MKKKRPLLAIAVLAVAVVLIGWQPWDSGSAAENPAAATGDSASKLPETGLATGTGAAGVGSAGPFSPAGLAARKQQLALWQQRYDRAVQVYSSYRDATRYPHESRPISEHPDQVRPFDPVTEIKTLRDASGRAVKGLRL